MKDADPATSITNLGSKNSNANYTDNDETAYTNNENDKPSSSSSALDKLHCVTDYRGKHIGLVNYLAVFLWLGWVGSYFLLLALLIFLYNYNKKAFGSLICFILFVTFIPIDRSKQPKWGYSIGSWVMKNGLSYFSVRLYFEDKETFTSKGPSLFFLEPHDVLPVSIFIFQDFCGFFKGHKMLGGVSSSIFNAPFMRHTLTWANAIPVEKDYLIKNLKEGLSLVICPGGAREAMYLANDSECTLFIKERYGLVKLAMEFGLPIYPTFTFGLRKLYPVWAPKSKFIKKWGSLLGYVPLFFLGAFNIPFAQPKSSPLTVVVGKPIFVEKVNDPSVLKGKDLDKETKKKLLEYHDQILESIERIFNTYKSEFDMGHVKLNIK